MNNRVLVFNLTTRGGMLHYSSQFCNELANIRSVSCVVASYYEGSDYVDSINRISIRTNPSLKSFILDSLLLHNHFRLFYRIIRFSPKIIHFIDNHPWYMFYAVLFRMMGYQIYVTQHDPVLHSGENMTLLGRVANLVNKVLRIVSHKLIVHGEKLKQDVISLYNIKADKILSIRHGTYNFFTKYIKSIPSEKNTFLFFGRIVDYKGLDILLESLDYITCADYKLIIAGAGSIEKYINLITKHKDNIELHNYDIPDEEVTSFFERCQFVVLPYKDASVSGIIPVAYSFSRPVIATSVGVIPDYVVDGVTGILVPPDNPEILAEKITWMLSCPTEVNTYGHSAKEFELSELSWFSVVNKIYN